MKQMIGENLCGRRWGWVLLLSIWFLDACFVHSRTLDSSLGLGDDRLESYKILTSPHTLHVQQAAKLKRPKVIPDTTKMTDVKAFTRVHDIASNNLTERLLSQSTNDDEKGLKGGLPFWVIPAIILGTTVTMILMVCMIISCSVTILFRRKSPNRSLRDYNHYTFHIQYYEEKEPKCVVKQTIS